jgi:glucuronoarabinoxylan endo-1,4-beta-xylanase
MHARHDTPRIWICLAVSGLSLLAGEARSADVAVDLNTTYQTMDGFGGMQDKGWTGYNLMSSDRDLLYGTGPGQIGLTIMRIRLNESQSAWTNDLVDAKDVASRGLKVFATEWSPPTSMRVASGSSYKIDPNQYQAYVDYINSFVKYMNTNGVPLYAVGFQNEPDYCSDWGCGTATEMYDFAKNYGDKLRVNGNKVITAESFDFSKSYYDPILNDATALANIDILGTHFYGTSKTSPDATFDYTLFKQKGAGHHFWMTEVYTAGVNNATSNTWPLCLDAAYEIHRAVALSNMSAYNWWYLKRSYGPLYIATNSAGGSTAGTVSKIGYIMGQYSKYIRPGAVRVDATRNVQTDVYTAAFKKADSVVVVSVNMATSSKSVTFSIPGLTSTSGRKITTSGTKNMADDGTISATGGNFTLPLDAQSISTVVFTGNGTTSMQPWTRETTVAGVYEVFDASGAHIGRVSLSAGQALPTQIARISTKSGLYFAKALGSQAVPVVVP